MRRIDVLDAGDRCIYCNNDTGWGSGRFVNRIIVNDAVVEVAEPLQEEARAVGAGVVEGYACAQCLEPGCDKCGEPVALDDDCKVGGAVYHYGCISRLDFAQHLLEEGYSVDDDEYQLMLEDYDDDHKKKD